MTASPPPGADTPPPGKIRVRGTLPGSERRSRLAPVISFLLHLLLILLAIKLTTAAIAPKDTPLGNAIHLVLGGGGGGGGQGGQAFAPSKPPPPAPVVPPPPPVVPVTQPPPVVTPQPVPPPVVTPRAATAPGPPSPVAAAGTGTGTGGGNGSGTGTGTGSGEGPGTGSGKGGGEGGGTGGFPPVNKQMIIPDLDHTPKQLRGKSVAVTFTVSAEGRVTDVVVTPPILDKGFASKFDELMRGYLFTPARTAEGKIVAGVTTITVSFGTK